MGSYTCSKYYINFLHSLLRSTVEQSCLKNSVSASQVVSVVSFAHMVHSGAMLDSGFSKGFYLTFISSYVE